MAGAASETASTVETTDGPALPVDVGLLGEVSKRHLTDVLNAITGLKTLVLDPALAGPLGLVADVALLKAHGVDRMFYLEPTGPLTNAQKNIIYLCGPKVDLMKLVAAQIKSTPDGKHSYTLLIAPRITSVCTSVLEDEGVLGSVEVLSFPLEFVPLEKNVLSLEIEESYKRIFLDGDYAPVFDMAKALMTIQRAYGLIPKIVGKGDAARRLADTLLRLRKELPSGGSGASSGLAAGPIDSLIIIDRTVDMATPMCTQLTYEGLIDEFIGIRNAHVEVDPAIVNPPPTALPSPSTTLTAVPAQAKRKKILLSSLDPLFTELRDKNFAIVGALLNRVAKRINSEYESRHQAQTNSQLRDFVGRLGSLQAEHQALRLHTGLTEELMKTTMTDEFNRILEIQQNVIAGIDLSLQENAIRDLLNNEAPLRTVLRLLCLYSVVAGGLKLKTYEEFKRDILQTYGYDYLPFLIHLSTLDLFRRAISGRSAFASSRKPLKLIVDDVDEQAPEDIAYVYSGYAPLSVRLVQCALGRQGSWRGLDDTLKPLPGKAFEETQKLDAEQAKARREPPSDQPTVSIVCFLGGCTYTEISALRFISQQSKTRKLLVATTDVCKAQGLLESLMPPPLRAK